MRYGEICSVVLLSALCALGVGCESCLNLDDYRLVQGPPPDAATSGSSTGSGTSNACLAPGNAAGTVVVSSIVPPGGLGGGSCELTAGPAGSMDLVALSPADGRCTARGSIVPAAGVTLDASPRIRHTNDALAIVASSFRGGSVELPFACDASSSVVVQPPAGATDALFVAKLRVDGSAFCTIWAKVAWTSDAGASGSLRVNAVDLDSSGRVVVAGALGGALLHLDGSPAEGARGGAFLARYLSDGSVGSLAALDDPAAAALGVAPRGDAWLVTGSARYEQPSCHGCPGSTHVLDAANACTPGSGGGGGAAGEGGAGGAGGGGGAGDGGATPDSTNALLWAPPEDTGGACAHMSTFGSDRHGENDVQVGFDIDPSPDACTAYWTGLAGRDPWRFAADTPASALFDTGGTSLDGFFARLDGGDALGCSGKGATWSVRMVPYQPAVVWGERISALRCREGATATATVRGAGSVDLHLCRANGGCEANAAHALLAGSGDAQLALMGLTGDGQLDWFAAFGPVETDADAGEGSFAGQSHHDIATDPRDWGYLVFTTRGPLEATPVEGAGCEQLQNGAPAGTWVVNLQPTGFAGKANCVWATRLGS